VHLVGILDGDHLFGAVSGDADARQRFRGILDQRLLEGGIGPGLGHHGGADLWAKLVLILVNQRVDGRCIDDTLLEQQGLHRLNAQRGIRGQQRMAGAASLM
jgi:hypothetical protein